MCSVGELTCSGRALDDIGQIVSARAVRAPPGLPLSPHLGLLQQALARWRQRRRWIQLDCPSYPYNSVSAGGSHTWSDRLQSPQPSPTLGPRRRWDPERRRTAWCDVSAWLGSVRGVWCQDLWAELQWSRPERWFRLTILLYADVRSRRTSSLRTSSALTDTDTRATSVSLRWYFYLCNQLLTV